MQQLSSAPGGRCTAWEGGERLLGVHLAVAARDPRAAQQPVDQEGRALGARQSVHAERRVDGLDEVGEVVRGDVVGAVWVEAVPDVLELEHGRLGHAQVLEHGGDREAVDDDAHHHVHQQLCAEELEGDEEGVRRWEKREKV